MQKKIILSLSLYIVLSFSTLLTAQVGLDAFAPVDPEIRSGVLDNGLTYFIRHNEEPEKRAGFYIIQNVGAILENDNQNGLAHFLEHMSFNGTEHFPGKALLHCLEKHGVAFGYNINAYTGFDETVYNLSDVPVDPEGLVDTCLLILNDWSNYLLLTEEEIDSERGVISEEWRTSKTAGRRLLFQVIRGVLKGSMYEHRDIIGSYDIINHFKPQTIRDFYHDWYRTDLQAIVVVGDVDVDEIETKIKNLFSKIPAVENPKPRLYEKIPYHADTRFILALDKEAPSTQVSVLSLHEAVPANKKNLNYIRENHKISLMNGMINSRIGEMLQKPNPPFVNGYIVLSEYVPRGYNAFEISATARQNEEAQALKAIYSEAERVYRYGFTEPELERAKAVLYANFEKFYNQRDKIDNETYIHAIQSYFLTGEPLTSVDFDFEFLKQVLNDITVEEINKLFRDYMTEDNRNIIVMGLEAEGVTHLTETESLDILNAVKSAPLDRYADMVFEKDLVEKPLKGSKITQTTKLPQYDAVQWTLENGVKVVFKKAGYEKDDVSLRAYSYGGLSQLHDSLVIPGYFLSALSSMYGAGDYDNVTLNKMLAGKKASVDFSLTETTEEISGSSTPKDFEIMMQLLYLKFAQPRFDKEAHNAYMTRFAAQIANMSQDPNKIKSDSISLITNNYSRRTLVLTEKGVRNISLNDIKTVYNNRFKGADEFTFFIVGNVDEETVRPLVEKYIGSLPLSGRRETWIDRQISQPKGKINKEIALNLTIPKSTVFISFEKDTEYDAKTSLGLDVLTGILDIVYVETVREKEGGTYGVSSSFSESRRPSAKIKGQIAFDCKPENSAGLKKIVYDELEAIAKSGPTQINLDKTVKNELKTREESKQHNSYWMNVMVNYYKYGIDYNDPANYEDILKSLTVRDIKKITKKSLKKANVVDITFNPAQ